MIRQTTALLLDAYRELNAKKLFWIVLGLSLLFAGSLGMITNNEQGLKILFWDVPIPMFSTGVVSKATFFKMMFIGVGFKLWLAWAASILALISTASMIPDFVSGGSIELTLSKPISRLRLFFTKYASGLLFVAIQVTVFATASFLIIGLRGGAWLPGLFIAVPLTVLFFSYLFAVCAFVGLLTRSTMTAFLVTILLWGSVWVIHAAESGIILQLKIRQEIVAASLLVDVQSRESELAEMQQDADADQDRVSRLEERLGERQGDLEGAEKLRDRLVKAHAILYAVKTVLPKTSETMDLLDRSLVKTTETEAFQDVASGNDSADFGGSRGVRVSQREVMRQMEETLRGRSLAWVLGTSIAFELVVLGAGAFVFCRRDF